MQMMRKLFLFTTTTSVWMTLFSVGYAQTTAGEGSVTLRALQSAGTAAGIETRRGTLDFITMGVQFVISLTGLFLLFYTMYAGYLYITSRGSSEVVDKAKGMLVHGLIGVVIVFSSYALVTFTIGAIRDRVGGELTNPVQVDNSDFPNGYIEGNDVPNFEELPNAPEEV